MRQRGNSSVESGVLRRNCRHAVRIREALFDRSSRFAGAVESDLEQHGTNHLVDGDGGDRERAKTRAKGRK